MGRMWWYQNYKVSEAHTSFLAYDTLGIQALCPDGKTPATAKAFRQNIKTHFTQTQLFDTAQSYFTAMSQSLGRISREDLKILNRAFFVKSISNIDQFIRENMLLEQESPSLDRLMENVRNGQEIAFSIETCEAKIGAIGRILRELKKLNDLTETGNSIYQRLRLISLYHEWSELNDLLKQRQLLIGEVASLETRIPFSKNDAEVATEKSKAAQARLLSNDVEAKISSIKRELSAFEEKVLWKQKILEKWSNSAKATLIKIPSTTQSWVRFLEDLDKTIQGNQLEIVELSSAIELSRENKFTLEQKSTELREELKHISQNSTLIPRELHGIKERALATLKLPSDHLFFVGELIQVKREFRHLRVAIESVLFPIARNLLCHPDALSVMTRWLESEGLRSDVTVKRIEPDELQPAALEILSVAASTRSSILDMIEIRPDSDHTFSHYLLRWLRSTFDYEVVDVKSFKSADGKLVTSEGLVKKDRRTMRKLKAQFQLSLGWNNADMIEKLTADLVCSNDDYKALISQLDSKVKSFAVLEGRNRLYLEMRDGHQEVISLESDLTSVKDLKTEIKRLIDADPDYEHIRKEFQELEIQAQRLSRGQMILETEVQGKKALLTKVDGLIPTRERDLKESKLYQDLCLELGASSALETALIEIEDLMAKKGISRLQLEGELKEEVQKIESAKGRAISLAAVNLGNYLHNFNDPNLPYDLGGEFSLSRFVKEWSTAEQRLKETELPVAQEKWKHFFDQILLDSVKDTINEIKSRIHEAAETIRSINEVLKLTNFEDLVDEQRYLQIDDQTSVDERIRKFRKSMGEVEKTLSPSMRSQIETQSQAIMSVLIPFVEEFQKDPAYRIFVTDVRNHFQFSVHSIRRGINDLPDTIVENFSGARKDAKSSAQTTQLAYALLASCLAYRFRFHDPVGGADTPRLIIFDEFGGKFDNEKPREVVKLLDKMGFQSVLVSPMSKADLLADQISQLVLVHKVSASRSKVQSYALASRADYDRLLTSVQNLPADASARA
jgi:uncharacterized protein YPO0396